METKTQNEKKTNLFTVNKYCDRCKNRRKNNQKVKVDCKECLSCYKHQFEIYELNSFIERMNEKNNTDCPKIKIE